MIIDVIKQHHGLSDSITNDRGVVFTSRFWSSMCYLLDINRQLLTSLHLQTNSQAKKQNSIIKVYLQVGKLEAK